MHAAGWALLVAAIAGCSRAGGAPERSFSASSAADQAAIETLDDERPLDAFARLEQMRATGRFEEFIDGALVAADAQPERADLQVLKSEALLASGLPGQAAEAARQAAALAVDDGQSELAVQALKRWTAARLREGTALGDPIVAELFSRLPAANADVRMIAFWHDRLADAVPFRFDASPAGAVELQLANAKRGSIPFELAAVAARANGVDMPLVFIDTGAQHTLMTADAAAAAGVTLGEGNMELVGFRGLTATPGVIETLELGDLVLHDVPVLVGDSAPLVALGGQISLGTELMHHVRVRIDYPARRVTVESADRASPTRLPAPIWDIPVWTFSHICLARGQLPAGPMARVLVDTGNGSGTFVSYRWGRRHLPQLRAASSSLVFRFKKRNLTLDGLDLGSGSLTTWPVADTMPAELDRLNQVDVILGHDLLWPYQLTIDLPRRVFELRPGSRPAERRDPPANENTRRDDDTK